MHLCSQEEEGGRKSKSQRAAAAAPVQSAAAAKAAKRSALKEGKAASDRSDKGMTGSKKRKLGPGGEEDAPLDVTRAVRSIKSKARALMETGMASGRASKIAAAAVSGGCSVVWCGSVRTHTCAPQPTGGVTHTMTAQVWSTCHKWCESCGCQRYQRVSTEAFLHPSAPDEQRSASPLPARQTADSPRFPEPPQAQPSELLLFPQLWIHVADFPCLHILSNVLEYNKMNCIGFSAAAWVSL